MKKIFVLVCTMAFVISIGAGVVHATEEKVIPIDFNGGEKSVAAKIAKDAAEDSPGLIMEKHLAEDVNFEDESRVKENSEVSLREAEKEPLLKNGEEEQDKAEGIIGCESSLSKECYLLNIPVDRVYISSHFGPRWGRLHTGTDFALPSGSNIYAAEAGQVTFTGIEGGYGNLIKVEHEGGMITYYAHCSTILVTQGQTVERGQLIGLVGSTGNSTGPHLHFEVIVDGSCVDPEGFLEL